MEDERRKTLAEINVEEKLTPGERKLARALASVAMANVDLQEAQRQLKVEKDAASQELLETLLKSINLIYDQAHDMLALIQKSLQDEVITQDLANTYYNACRLGPPDEARSRSAEKEIRAVENIWGAVKIFRRTVNFLIDEADDKLSRSIITEADYEALRLNLKVALDAVFPVTGPIELETVREDAASEPVLS